MVQVTVSAMGDVYLEDNDRLERLGQANSIGVLADRILLAVAAAREGRGVSDDASLERGERMLRALAEYSEGPFDITAAVRMSPAIRLLREEGIGGAMPASRHVDTSGTAAVTQTEWLSGLADAIADIRSGKMQERQLLALETLFEIISNNTLETATDISRSDSGARWNRASTF